MFAGFAHVWTPVLFSHQLKAKPQQVQLAGEKLVLFRDAEGHPRALLDSCPHRGAALSLGQVSKSGCITCPFHGWEFAGDGSCSHVPLNPMSEGRRSRIHTAALPVREVGSLVWVFTRPGTDQEQSEPIVPEALDKTRFTLWFHRVRWKVHWTRLMENMIDSPHVPFVHRTTIGVGFARKMTRDSRMEILVDPDEGGFKSTIRFEGQVQQEGGLRWRRPNAMELRIPIPGRVWRQHIWCVPVDEETTDLLLVASRDFQRWNPLARIMDEFNRIIVQQDKAVTESSWPRKVPPPGEELSVASDRATLFFRNWYYQELESSLAERPALRRKRLPGGAPALSAPAEEAEEGSPGERPGEDVA